MKIKKIEIKNFKNISSKGLTINCNDRLNCFIGKNGVGKSAVFDAVKCLIEASNGIENIKKIFKEQSFVSLKSLRINNDDNQKNVLIKVNFYDDSNVILEISFRKQDLIDNSPKSLLALSEYSDRIKSPGGLCEIPAKFSLYCSHFVDKNKICELCQSHIKQIKVISADRMQEKRTDNNSCLGNNFLAADNESQIGRITGISGQKFHYFKMYDDRLLVKDDLINYDTSIFEENYDKAQIAISLSHMYAYKEINEKYDNALILEDDAILHDNFSEIFEKYMNELPSHYDMLFIGDAISLPYDNIKDKYIYEANGTRCTDSYLVSKNCAIKICEYIKNINNKINLPIDHWLNIPINDLKLKIYWAHPTIVSQGTINGVFASSHTY